MSVGGNGYTVWMRKALFALPLVLALAGCAAHVDVTIVPPKTPAASWATSCKLVMVAGDGFYPQATVTITNTGKSTQEYSAYRLYFWSGGIIVGFWNAAPGTTYASLGEEWSQSWNVQAALPGDEVESASVNGTGPAVYTPDQDFLDAKPITCTVAHVT
jgi:hypothetical protein